MTNNEWVQWLVVATMALTAYVALKVLGAFLCAAWLLLAILALRGTQ